MTRRHGIRSTVAAAAIGLAAFTSIAAPSASADTQPVSAVAASVLGMALAGPVVLTPLTPGTTSTGASSVIITATGPWVLRVSDAATAHPGRLLRTSGSTGDDFLASALSWTTTPALGGTGGSGTLTGTPATAASGTFTNVVVTGFTQPVGASENLASGSTYGLTITWTVSAT